MNHYEIINASVIGFFFCLFGFTSEVAPNGVKREEKTQSKEADSAWSSA